MKLIIDIPQEALKEMKTKEFISIESLDAAIECIENGIPLDNNSDRAEVQAYFAGQTYGWEEGRKALLDDVKAEIEEYRSTIDRAIAEDELKIEGMKEAYTDCLEIIDNIGKAESEGEE